MARRIHLVGLVAVITLFAGTAWGQIAAPCRPCTGVPSATASVSADLTFSLNWSYTVTPGSDSAGTQITPHTANADASFTITIADVTINGVSESGVAVDLGGNKMPDTKKPDTKSGSAKASAGKLREEIAKKKSVQGRTVHPNDVTLQQTTYTFAGTFHLNHVAGPLCVEGGEVATLTLTASESIAADGFDHSSSLSWR